MKNIYIATFEVPYPDMPLILFHPKYLVEAKNMKQAKKRAQDAFNSHPHNVELERELVNIEKAKEVENESLIFRLED